jgi:glycosidase
MDPSGKGDPSKGIDGWRLDVADRNSHTFWKGWSAYVRSINPDAYLTGEVINTPGLVKPFINAEEFDAVMNYNFLFATSQYFLKGKYIFPTSRFDSLLQAQRSVFPEEVNLAMQNLLGSHDTDRPLSRIVNRRAFSFLDRDHFFNDLRGSNRMYKTEKPRRGDLEIMKLMIIFQMTYPGAPLIFYGDEVSMWGAKDPCCRKPMVWEDIAFSDEVYLPNGMQKRVPEKVMMSNDMLNHYKKLIRIRNTYTALQLGDFKTVLIDDDKEIYCFSRIYKNESIFVLINNSTELQNVSVKVDKNGLYFNALDENREMTVIDGTLSMDIKPNWGAIWIKKD